ncbi:uncharacterized protein GJ701_008150 [Geothlypis trichas]
MEPQERPLRAQEWNGEARSSRRSGLFGLKRGTARQERASASASLSPGVERQEAVGRRGKSGGGVDLKSGTARQEGAAGAEEGREGPSGQRAFPGQGTFRVPRLSLCWATSLCAGLVFAVVGPFALVLLWLPGERGNPVEGG